LKELFFGEIEHRFLATKFGLVFLFLSILAIRQFVSVFNVGEAMRRTLFSGDMSLYQIRRTRKNTLDRTCRVYYNIFVLIQ
jgi:heme A synthase